MAEHALLSASGSKKWLTCTPSARLEEAFPDEQSEAAKEGTMAHDCVEWALNHFYHGKQLPEHVNTVEKRRTLGYTKEMEDAAAAFLAHAREITDKLEGEPYQVLVERKLDYSRWAPEGFGTGDLLILSRYCMWVRDFKYGTGVRVEAEENSQMSLYGLGAWHEAEFVFDEINEVDLGIFQPRLSHYPNWRITLDNLLAWGEAIKPVAQKAWNGEGAYVPGQHCKDCFCKARGSCTALAEYALALADANVQEPETMSPTRIAELLPKLALIEVWAKSVREFALKSAVDDGVKYPGYKLVAGKSNRVITDKGTAAIRLTAKGFQVMKEPELLGIGALEDLLGIALFNEILGDLILKPPGAPALVPISDKRAEWKPVSSPEDDFSS